jgi:hypothetical protein
MDVPFFGWKPLRALVELVKQVLEIGEQKPRAIASEMPNPFADMYTGLVLPHLREVFRASLRGVKGERWIAHDSYAVHLHPATHQDQRQALSIWKQNAEQHLRNERGDFYSGLDPVQMPAEPLVSFVEDDTVEEGAVQVLSSASRDFDLACGYTPRGEAQSAPAVRPSPSAASAECLPLRVIEHVDGAARSTERVLAPPRGSAVTDGSRTVQLGRHVGRPEHLLADNDFISREHARLEWDDAGVQVRDGSTSGTPSANGTFFNGRRLEYGEASPVLAAGDRVAFGAISPSSSHPAAGWAVVWEVLPLSSNAAI